MPPPPPLLSLILALWHGLAMAGLAALMLVVAAAVLGRALFDLTGGAVDLMLPGAIELSTHALLVAVLAALPGALLAGLVRVDLIAARLPASLGRWLDRLWALTAAGFGAVAAWLLASRALTQAARGDLTQDLGIALWPVTGFAAMAMAMLALTGLALATGLVRPGASLPQAGSPE